MNRNVLSFSSCCLLEFSCRSQPQCAAKGTAVMAAPCRATLPNPSESRSQTADKTTVGAQWLLNPAAQISAALSNCAAKHLRSHFKAAGLHFSQEMFSLNPSQGLSATVRAQVHGASLSVAEAG